MNKFLPILFIVLVVSILIYAQIFKIKKINFKDDNNCINSQVLNKELGINGKNLIVFNTNSLINKIKENYSCVDQVKVSKKYPNFIDIEIQTKEPIVLVEGTQLTLREDGLISEQGSLKNLPKIFLPETIKAQAGAKIENPQVSFALKTTRELLKSDFTPTAIRILKPPDIAIYDSKGTIVLFSQEKAVDIQVDSLQSVFAKAKIDPTKIAKIDLRFENPVVTTKQ